MMFDHAFEEQPIELGAFRVGQPFHLVRGQHAGHQRGTVHVHRVPVRHLLASYVQPALHHLDLIVLRELDAQGEPLQVLAAASRLQQFDHLQCLRMMADHPLHELDVGPNVLHPRQVGRLVSGDDLARLARRARLDDRRFRVCHRGGACPRCRRTT